MTTRVVSVLAILLVLGSLQGCFEWQRAWGCSEPGILGCKDIVPEGADEITQPGDSGLKRAPPGGRQQQPQKINEGFGTPI